ncbi:MAG: hypothetical protein ACETV0_08845, partial [Nitrososphaeria archaeon]
CLRCPSNAYHVVRTVKDFPGSSNLTTETLLIPKLLFRKCLSIDCTGCAICQWDDRSKRENHLGSMKQGTNRAVWKERLI